MENEAKKIIEMIDKLIGMGISISTKSSFHEILNDLASSVQAYLSNKNNHYKKIVTSEIIDLENEKTAIQEELINVLSEASGHYSNCLKSLETFKALWILHSKKYLNVDNHK